MRNTMAKNLLCAVLLLTLAAVTARAQTVTLRACNPGTTEVDVYFAQGSNVVSQHVGPADCANLASTQGGMPPGLVAVGFADVQSQWGGVHRYERVPNFGPGVAQSTTQTLSVTHGTTRVSIPAQFNFQPPKPECFTYRGQLGPLGTAPEFTRCDDFKYDVNVLAFPDTREVAFQRFCQICDDQAEARKTPEQRATEKQIADLKQALINNLPMSMRVTIERDTKRQDSREESKDRYRESLERDPTKWDHIGWSDVPRYSRDVFSNVALQGSAAVLQGTLSGMQRHNASDPWFDVFFQESPDHKFILCTTNPDVLSDLFGANYSTAMVGKKIEVEGVLAQCLGAPGILLKVAHQIKLVGTGPGMVAAVTPPAFKFPEDLDRRVLTEVPLPGSVAYDSGKLAWARELLERNCKRLYTTRISLAQGPNTIADPELVKADAAACMERFDLAKLVPHEQAAIRYCVANHNFNAVPPYTPQRDAVLRAYSECVIQNDPVIIPCEEWRRITVNFRPPGDYDDCPPVPSRDEMEAILQGKQGPIPSTPPGLPAIQLPPASANAATAKAVGESGGSAQVGISNAPVPAPAPAQAPLAAPASLPSAPASPQRAAAQGSSPADTARERMMKLQACNQEVMTKLGPNALSDPASLQKAVLDCIQR